MLTPQDVAHVVAMLATQAPQLFAREISCGQRRSLDRKLQPTVVNLPPESTSCPCNPLRPSRVVLISTTPPIFRPYSAGAV